MIDPDTTRPAKTDHAVARIVDGEAVVVEPQNGMVNVINQIGTSIWELTDGQRTVREIAALVAGDFDVSRDQALADTIEFLRNLNEKGLVILTQLIPTDDTDADAGRRGGSPHRF